MDLIIVELNAHAAGHYSKEITNFANIISNEFNTIQIITPFGFKENFKLQPNIKVVSIFNSITNINFIFQIKFYSNVFRMVRNSECLLHFWGHKSVLPIFISSFLYNKKLDFITLKDIERNRVGIFRLKILGAIQKSISNYYLNKISKFYIVHNEKVLYDAKKIGISKNKICLIKTGIETVNKCISKFEAREILNLDLKNILILFFGVIREEKGIFELLKMVNQFEDNIKLMIVGENWLGISLSELVDEYGIKDKVLIIDKYIGEDDLANYFITADINLIYHKPSFKGESGVLLNAIAFGLPSITHQYNSAAKIIEENRIGEVCNYLDSNDLNEKLKIILKRKHVYEENMARYREKNNMNKMKNEYIINYKRIEN